MKKTALGKLKTVICAVIAVVLVFSLAACGDKKPTTQSGVNNGLTLNVNTLTMDKGSPATLLVTSSTTEDVVWTSSDESVVTVTGTGTGNRAASLSALETGTVTITATAGANYATCIVTVLEAETISVKKDGSEVTSVTLSGKGATAQLTATSSRDHKIVWSTNKDKIVEVSDSGVITAVETSGTAVITATCAQHSDVSTSITVVVGSGVDAAYDLKQGDQTAEFGNPVNSNALPGEWLYWNQYNNVNNATYNNGVVSFTTSGVEAGALWYNVQLFYTAAPTDTDTAGAALKAGTHYKVDFDLSTTMAGDITVNGYVLHVSEGSGTYTIYYDHAVTAFSMQLGVEGIGCNLTNADITLSNIKWTVSQKVQLDAPTFSIDDGVITITDTNPAEGVSGYTLNLYNGGSASIAGIAVENGKKVDTSRVIINGTYEGRLVANAANAHYISSSAATAENNQVVVNNEAVTYSMESTAAAGALKEVGLWTYWKESWVTFSSSVTGDKAKITFSNNSGNWYDTQLFYKIPGKGVGDKYTATLHLDNVPNAGRITVNGKVHTLQQGSNSIELEITETAQVTLTIVFGVDGENQKQEIQSATDMSVYVEY